jgi:hypothetical protein
MFHEDWHTAEKLGLSYVRYFHHGPDYWDDEMVFAKTSEVDVVTKYLDDSSW